MGAQPIGSHAPEALVVAFLVALALTLAFLRLFRLQDGNRHATAVVC